MSEHDMIMLVDAIRELSKQFEMSKEANRKEKEILTKYKDTGLVLEFSLANGGIVEGVIDWIDEQCIGVRMRNDKVIILYKHVIAFIQEKA